MTDTQREFERLHHLAHPNFNNYEKLPSGKYANKFVQDDWIYFQWVWQAAIAHSQQRDKYLRENFMPALVKATDSASIDHPYVIVTFNSWDELNETITKKG